MTNGTTNLPEWTNNRLIVGLIIAFFSCLIAAFTGTVPWYAPLILLLFFSVIIVWVLIPHRISTLFTNVIAKLPQVSRVIVKLFLFSCLVLVTIGIIYGFSILFKQIINEKVTWVEFVKYLSKNSATWIPILFYTLLVLMRNITSMIYRARKDSVLGSLSNIGHELCSTSLFITLVMPFIIPNIYKLSNNTIFYLILTNLLFFILALVVSARSNSIMNKGSKIMWNNIQVFILIMINYFLGTMAISTTIRQLAFLAEYANYLQ